MKFSRQEIADRNHSTSVSQCVIHGIMLGICLLVLSLASVARVPAIVTPAADRKSAPDFNLTDAAGAPVRLADFKGRVVLLDFWATWCHGCMLEIPWFIQFQKEYKAGGLSVIGVSMDDDGWKVVKPFIAMKKMNYPVVLNGEDLDKRYGLGSMPMAVLIDKNGRIADSHSGVVDKAKWEAEIKSLLNEN